MKTLRVLDRRVNRLSQLWEISHAIASKFRSCLVHLEKDDKFMLYKIEMFKITLC